MSYVIIKYEKEWLGFLELGRIILLWFGSNE